jgi:hypothetical protein
MVAEHWQAEQGQSQSDDASEGRIVLVENTHFVLIEPSAHFFRGLNTHNDGMSVELFDENYCELCEKQFDNPTALMQHRDRLHTPDSRCSSDVSVETPSGKTRVGPAKPQYSCRLCHSKYTLESALAQHRAKCMSDRTVDYIPPKLAPTDVTREIVLRAECVGAVIGCHGMTIRNLASRFHLVNASVVSAGREKPAILRLVGSEFYVNNAFKQLRNVLEPKSPDNEYESKSSPLRLSLRASVTAQKSQALLVVEREKMRVLNFAQLCKLIRDKMGIRSKFGFLEVRRSAAAWGKSGSEFVVATVLREDGPVFQRFIDELLERVEGEWVLMASGR